jgi:elongation factor Ts
MAEITTSLVKELRERTGAGMMDCKRALTEVEGDLDAATDLLRKKGLAAAAKKAGRVAAEGLVGMALAGGTAGALVEVNAETDFVARNDNFQELVRRILALAPQAKGDLEALKSARIEATGRTVEEEVTQAVVVIGENLNLRRAAYLEVGSGVVAGYLHNQLAPGLGKLGVLVALASTGDAGRLAELGRQLAMHVAASNPHAVSADKMDPALVQRERAIHADQARASGKPDNIVEKMVEGRVRKFYEESTLMAQTFVIDGETKVADVVKKAEKEAGAPIKVTRFVRYALGDGIAKEETDFAAEVAATSGVPQNAPAPADG